MIPEWGPNFKSGDTKHLPVTFHDTAQQALGPASLTPLVDTR